MNQRGVIVDSNKKSKSKSTAQAMLNHENKKAPQHQLKKIENQKEQQANKQTGAPKLCRDFRNFFSFLLLSSPSPSSVHFLPFFLCGWMGGWTDIQYGREIKQNVDRQDGWKAKVCRGQKREKKVRIITGRMMVVFFLTQKGKKKVINAPHTKGIKRLERWETGIEKNEKIR